MNSNQKKSIFSEKNQSSNKTLYNRHPRHFSFISNFFNSLVNVQENKNINILSFGCSIGLEPLSLAELYFNKSCYLIDAVDISDDALQKAKSENPHERIKYFNSKLLDKTKKYDIIFANSVLCNYPSKNLGDISAEYPFDQFQESIASLLEILKKGGILMTQNNSYKINDTRYASDLLEISNSLCRDSGFVPIYKKNGKLSLLGYLRILIYDFITKKIPQSEYRYYALAALRTVSPSIHIKLV